MTSMYHSTRNADACVSAKRAVLNGLASDGGLYVTDALGETKIDLERVVANTYRENAAYILGTLLDDYSAEEIESCVEAAYKGTFETDDVAPGRRFVRARTLPRPDKRLQRCCAADASSAHEPSCARCERKNHDSRRNERRYRQGCFGWFREYVRAGHYRVLPA